MIKPPSLTERLQKLCGERFVTFAEFMQAALYDEAAGYYRGARLAIGAEGDFVTAPHISSAFAHAVFQVLRAQTRSLIPQPTAAPVDIHWVEPASADGTLALALWRQWQALPIEAVRLHYHAIEPHPAKQQQWLANINAATHAAVQPNWHWQIHANLHTLPDPLVGVVFANELFDALPCEVVAWDADGMMQKGVAWKAKTGFHWTQRRVEDAILAATMQRLPPSQGVAGRWTAADFPLPYTHEINLAAKAWVAAMMNKLQRGYALFFDYGDTAENLYHPSRNTGTLKAIHQHQIVAALWENIGAQDLTAHVDFSALADAAVSAGGELIGLTSQASFMVQAGIEDWLQALPTDPFARARALAGFRQLIEPSMMGSAIQAIAWAKNMNPEALCRRGFVRD